jgi:6-phosphogluconolactonase
MSASRSLLQTASAGVLLFAGEAKRQAWRQFGAGAGTGSVVECPARLMAGIGDAAVFTDLL